MNKSISIVVLVITVSACSPFTQSTPTIPPAITLSREAPTTLPTLLSTPTILPSAIMPSREAPIALPTSTLIEGWFVYQNDLLGYEFSYPPQASISSYGPDGYSPDDVPPDMKLDYFALLDSLYQDDLCVALGYEMGFIIIHAPPNKGGNFVTCGVTGVGDVDLIRKAEEIVIDGRPYTANGHEEHARDAAATFLSEVLVIYVEDGTQIQYGWLLGKSWGDL